MPGWIFDVTKGSPQIWQVTSLTSHSEGHPLSQPRGVDASFTLTLLIKYSELKWHGNLNVDYRFNASSLDTEGASGDVVGILEVGPLCMLKKICLELELQMQKQAQNHHASTVPVSKREHEDGCKEHVTSLVLRSKQNLYNCTCERQYPLYWHFQLWYDKTKGALGGP